MMTILSIGCYLALAVALVRVFRIPKRSDELAARLLRQYTSDGED